MKIFNKKRVFALSAILMLNLFAVGVFAQPAIDTGTTPAAADQANFVVTAIIPENQIDKRQTYFDLRMEPGQTQVLQVNVTNKSSAEITVEVRVSNASTNRNGIIEYQAIVQPDESLKTPFDTIAKTQPQITLKANESKMAEITVAMPENSFDGVLLGGIVFTKRNGDNHGSGVSINNQFSYVVGVKLSQTDAIIQPDFKLKAVTPLLVNHRNAVVADILNTAPLIIKDVSVDGQIYKKGGAQPVVSISKDRVEIAPNSVFPLPFEWDGNKIDPGEYQVNLKLSYNGKDFEWSRDFTVDGDTANEIHDATLNKPTEFWHRWWWVPVVIIGGVFLLWITFNLGKSSRKSDGRR